MLKIVYTKPFLKQFSKLQKQIQEKAKKAILIFQKNPKDHTLKAHKLEGKLKDFYSFSVDYKIRIVFELLDDNAVFLKIGNHDIYK